MYHRSAVGSTLWLPGYGHPFRWCGSVPTGTGAQDKYEPARPGNQKSCCPPKQLHNLWIAAQWAGWPHRPWQLLLRGTAHRAFQQGPKSRQQRTALHSFAVHEQLLLILQKPKTGVLTSPSVRVKVFIEAVNP